MVLKRQTVWLLTMLSLIIVLSVYYMTSPGESLDNYAYVDEDEANVSEDEAQVSLQLDEEGMSLAVQETEEGVISAISSDETFTTLRLERQISRDRMLESFTNIITSDASAEAIAQAVSKQEALLAQQQQEELLETLVKTKGYDDVLVIARDDNNVNIIVKADELTPAQVVEILGMARDQLGEKQVAVVHQPISK
ncbi:SpoIIIAH-like family protein [Bacillus alkalicellulosilyticus]|uniref:SpoIIIAH-like family protein n=1 Tax=Alkalihalobacterium alkalicellulosilyticum TaxID=1912214 RepID=UPI000996E15D|nr:SpoIIIAH-like family protein [Bacillus alkalicellulosilyticus]